MSRLPSERGQDVRGSTHRPGKRSGLELRSQAALAPRVLETVRLRVDRHTVARRDFADGVTDARLAATADHQNRTRRVAGADQDMRRVGWAMEELPLPERQLFVVHDGEALARQHEEEFFRSLGVVERGRLSRLDDAHVDAEVLELLARVRLAEQEAHAEHGVFHRLCVLETALQVFAHGAGSTLSCVPEPAQLERRTTELLQRLIRFNTVNPPGNEQAAQEFLKGLLEEAGFECELLSAVEGRPNLVARLRASSDGPRLCLLGHVDTVLANPEEWSVDPWSGELRGGCVWGRGALDMKSQVAAEAAAALALAHEGWRPESGELLLVFTADEETGAAHGARWLCENHAEKVACDMVVNEGAGEVFEFDGRRHYGVCAGEKGVFRFTLTTSGRAGHASIPRIGDNALVKLAPILDALSDGRPVYELSPEPEAFMRALGLDTSDLEAALRSLEERDPRIAVLLEPMLGVTCTPTMVSASEKINVIPSLAR